MKSLPVIAIVCVLAVGGVCWLASMPAAVYSPDFWTSQGANSNATKTSLDQGIAGLADQVRTAAAEVGDAQEVIRKLRSDRAAATLAEAELIKDLKLIAEELPRLETALKACADAEKDAQQAHRESRDRFRDYCKQKDPPGEIEKQHVDLGRLVRRGVKLTPDQTTAWHFVEPHVRKGILNHLNCRERLEANEQDRASEAAQLTARRQSLGRKIDALRTRLANGPQELSRSRAILSQISPSSLATAEAELTRKLAARDRLKAQLANAETKRAEAMVATQKRAAQESRRLANVERASKAEAEQAPVAAVTPATRSWGSGQRGGFSNLPPVVRLLILAEAAGEDIGLDLFPDDDPLSPAAPIYEAIPPLAPAGPSTTVHADGFGATHRQGNQTLVERANGPSALYTREGPWEAVQYSNGVIGRRYYDDTRGVIQFDYANPNTGVETIGEEPYEGNDYGQGWSRQAPLR